MAEPQFKRLIVLRLLTRPQTLAVFPDAIRYCAEKHCFDELVDLETGGEVAISSALQRVMERVPELQRSDAGVRLLVAGTLTRFTMLPWRDELSTSAEHQFLARNVLQQKGIPAHASQAIVTCYPRYHDQGYAYWYLEPVNAVVATLKALKMKVEEPTPFLVAAIRKYGGGIARQTQMIVVVEIDRISAMLLSGNKLLAYEVEPKVLGPDDSLSRMAYRLRSKGVAASEAIIFSDDVNGVSQDCLTAMADRFQEMQVRSLSLGVLGSY